MRRLILSLAPLLLIASSACGSGDKGQTGATGADGVSGATGPQGPVGPQGAAGAAGAPGAAGSAGPNGYTAVAIADGASMALLQGTISHPVSLATLTVTAPEAGKVLLTVTGTCAFFGSVDTNIVTVAIRSDGSTAPFDVGEGTSLGIPLVAGTIDVHSTGSFSTQRVMDVVASTPTSFTAYGGRGAVDPSLGTTASCRVSMTALFVKSAF